MNNKKITNEKMKEIQEQINTTVNKIINYNWHTQQNDIINEQIILKQQCGIMEQIENEQINQTQSSNF